MLFKVRGFDIDYNVLEDDVDYLLSANPTDEEVEAEIEKVKNSLDKEVTVLVDFDEEYEKDLDNFESAITDALADKTGWLFNYYNYKIIKKE